MRKNQEVLGQLGVLDAKSHCMLEKRATPKRKALPASSIDPTRGSRRLAGEKAPNLFVVDDEGHQLVIGGDDDEVSALTVEERAAKDAERQAAWEAARERAAAAGGPAPGLPLPKWETPRREDFESLGTPCFHLNTFIRSQATPRENRAFGLFLKLGIATPGFGELKGETLQLVQAALISRGSAV